MVNNYVFLGNNIKKLGRKKSSVREYSIATIKIRLCSDAKLLP